MGLRSVWTLLFVIMEEIGEGTLWAMMFEDDLVLCDPDRETMEVRLERWRECMENNGLKVSRVNTENLQTTEDTDPVRMKKYTETEGNHVTFLNVYILYIDHVIFKLP